MAIAGFVLAFFCSLLGLILSIIAYVECKRSNGAVRGEGLALGGIIVSTLFLLVGVVAAVTIPACVERAAQSFRRAEAEVQLERIGRAAGTYYVTNGKFPAGTAATLPARPCCTNRDHKCEVTSSWDDDPVWRELDFEVYGSSYFQYRYEGTAESFTATAVGDLDCDGNTITYRIVGRARNGQVETELRPRRHSDSDSESDSD
jgi:hypothetical protein